MSSTRQTWLNKVTATSVAGMTYDACVAMQSATNLEGDEYAAKVAEMRAIAAEVGVKNPSGTLCRLHALITATALPVIAKRLEFGA